MFLGVLGSPAGVAARYQGNWCTPLMEFLVLLLKEFEDGLKRKLEDSFTRV